TIIGVFIGGILFHTGFGHVIYSVLENYPNYFMLIFLPPLIYETAYNLRIPYFFKNIGAILTYSILGTSLTIVFNAFLFWAISLTGVYLHVRNTFIIGIQFIPLVCLCYYYHRC